MPNPAGVSLGLIRVFDGLFFFALAMVIVVIVSTLLSDQVRTSRVWLNLMIAWLVYSISYLLLVGRQTGPEPPFRLCLFQAAMVYAVPALCAIATACCVLDAALLVSGVFKSDMGLHPIRQVALLAVPWMVFLSIASEILLFVGISDTIPTRVRRADHHYFCHLTTNFPGRITAAAVLLAVIFVVVIQGWIVVILKRNWQTFKGLKDFRTNFSVVVHAAILSAIIVHSVVFSVLTYIFPAYTQKLGVLFALGPILSSLAFGTRRQILTTWKGWIVYVAKFRVSFKPPVQPVRKSATSTTFFIE